MTLTNQEKIDIQNLATQFPHNGEVVEDVYKAVKDINKTRIILEYSCKLAVSVYPIIRLIRSAYFEKSKIEAVPSRANVRSISTLDNLKLTQ